MNTDKPTVRVQCAEAMGWVEYTGAALVTYEWAPGHTAPAVPKYYLPKFGFHGNGCPQVCCFELPAYDTDANAALTMVDALRAEGWRCSLNSSSVDGTWECQFERGVKHYAVAATICLAICAAFLRVKGAK